MEEHASPEPASASLVPFGLPNVDPDAIEDRHAGEIDNIVPTRGYHAQPVVGLGGSAGSIPALRTFFENTPSTSGLAYVVVLHLAPEHGSTLPELLQQHTTMPVHAAVDGDKMEANAVYVIPPGKHLTATDGHLKLTDLRLEPGKRVAVDLFFRSLADTHGPHATAVVLSGADGDGAIGLKRIKERGGLTIAQLPVEAEHSSMPRSAIATGMVDWVLPVTEMPARIFAYHDRATRLRLPSEEGPQPAAVQSSSADETEAQLREVISFLRASTGRDFSCYKRATIVRRVARRMQVNSVDDLQGYLNHLRTHPGETGALLQDLLISVTNFFRDRECFDALEPHISELFKDKKPGDSVRVWIPACATGEEAYSMAILLLERARQFELPPKLQVFGCDLDEEAIQKARMGFYPDTIAADVSEERLRRFFVREPGGYRVRHELREMVLFAAHDLLKDSPFSRMDLVSCRNMLIYLNRDAQARAVDIFHLSLRPSGLLFLGSSESVEEGSPLFAPIDKKHRLYRQLAFQRLGLAVPTGAGALERLLQKHERLKYEITSLPGNAFLPVEAPQDENSIPEAPAGELHLKLLSRFGPPSLVVDSAYEIVHLSENANRFLQFPEGEPTRNVLRLVHPMLRVDLRAALLRAAENDIPVEIRRRVVELSGGPEVVEIRVIPAGLLATGYLLVIFEARKPGDSEDAEPLPTTLEPEAVVQLLERELTRANSNLRTTVEQYETGVEELKASNEELQAMNEELRSAGEELETSREELQSVNEELSTVNSELWSRLEELGRANSDLRNLMTATAIATVFLGRDLEIMRYTPMAVPLFNLIPGDVGRPIADLKTRLDYPGLIGDAEQVLRTLVPIEREIRDNGHWFLARMLPYRTLEDHIAGVVLTLVDITKRREAETALQAAGAAKNNFLAVLSHELRTPLTPIAMAAQSLSRRKDLPESVLEALEMIRRNVQLEARLVDDLLDVTRIERGKMELNRSSVEMHEVIRRAVETTEPLFKAKHQRLVVDLHATGNNMEGDANRLQQVIWNLLSNASKFTPEEGEIRIRTWTEPGKLLVEVHDSGIGIEEEALPRIFEAFSQADVSITRRFGGLGLGLAIARAIVSAHDGELRVSSEGPGRGAAFTVVLPVIQSKE